MTDNATPLAEVTPETAAPVAAEPNVTTTPQGENPAGNESEAKDDAAGLKDQLEGKEDKPSEAELKRRERNKERWRNMKAEMEQNRIRAELAEREVQRLRAMAPKDYSELDPDDALAERTAAKIREGQASDIERQAEASRIQAQRAMAEAWKAQVEDIRTEHPDFDEAFAKTPIHTRAAPFIAQSEKGGELAYYLAKNPQEANALYDQFDANPALALIELGRLEARVGKPPAKTTSKAPQPASTLSGGRTPPATEPGRGDVGAVQAMLRKAGVLR